jgi:hypothetical protein
MRRHYLVIGFLAVSMSASELSNAQETSQSAGAAPSKTHRFFDSPNVSLIVAESGALLADGITTQYGLHHFGGREADPFARPFVNHGWPGMIAGGALFISAEVGARYLLHKHNHHRAERWLPTFVIAYGATGAIYNWVQIHNASGRWGTNDSFYRMNR